VALGHSESHPKELAFCRISAGFRYDFVLNHTERSIDIQAAFGMFAGPSESTPNTKRSNGFLYDFGVPSSS
jgi:hypothetical protein